MAGEYSREMGVKILAGLKRLATLGFKQGGRPGYGLRRMLVSPSGVPKQLLAFGERKGIASDRVILAPGPTNEVQCVRDIYRMLISGKRTVYAIACELNRRGVVYTEDSNGITRRCTTFSPIRSMLDVIRSSDIIQTVYPKG